MHEALATYMQKYSLEEGKLSGSGSDGAAVTSASVTDDVLRSTESQIILIADHVNKGQILSLVTTGTH